ncbi:MAG: phosphoribosylglycinamide formyltransferase [Gemmatimonadota bacterium]
MTAPARIAVFASGGGTNLQALLDHFNAHESGVARVELVVASRQGIGAIGRAERLRVPAVVVDPASTEGGDSSGAILRELERHRIDLIALAGYLKLIPERVVEEFRGRILNIHPALLPSFGGPGMYGMRVHRAVLASGAMVTGPTVHLVDERYDEGSVLVQWPVPVLPGDTPEQLAARVLTIEHILYPLAVERVVRGDPAGSLSPGLAFDLIDPGPPPVESVRRLLG